MYNLTQLTGSLAFASAALLAWSTSRIVPRQRRSWLLITTVYAILALEVVAGSRHHVSAAIGDLLRAVELYSDRRLPQLVTILVLATLALLVSWRVVRGVGSRAMAVAAVTTLLLVVLFLIESVSLHVVDQVLYQSLGPLLLIGWLWLACGLTISIAAGSALLCSRKASSATGRQISAALVSRPTSRSR